MKNLILIIDPKDLLPLIPLLVLALPTTLLIKLQKVAKKTITNLEILSCQNL
ncbi:MAG: hypothetical protein BAJALOKI1v1_350002 [Promethearchaeota archaeon]|nr:MAG: hypothetical protein BAJALOKI1v1_350002 [Candidatus Lokiarchaeota archaeon]